MFERFTQRTRQAVVLASEEATILGHRFVGTEHLLLGMLRVPESVAAQVLVAHGIGLEQVRRAISGGPDGPPAGELAVPDAEALRAVGIDLDEVRRAVEESFGAGALEGTEAAVRRVFRWRRRPAPGRPAFSPAARALLARSLREALELGHNYIGTEHLLLAASRPQAGPASQILSAAGLPYDTVKAQVRDKLAARRR